MSIGEKIYDLRKKKNISQEALAMALNVSRQTISKWETGESNPDFDKIVPLCEFFDISPDELLNVSNKYLEREIIREQKKNKSLMISLCIIIFIVMCILLSILDEINANDSIMGTVSLISLGAIAVILVNFFLNNNELPEVKKPKELTKKRLINSIINIIILLIYLGISFFFDIWEYSWVILIIGALIKKIITLIMMLGGKSDEK